MNNKMGCAQMLEIPSWPHICTRLWVRASWMLDRNRILSTVHYGHSGDNIYVHVGIKYTQNVDNVSYFLKL